MKTLMLLRHAKSSWDDETLDDHDRPLNKRGKKIAPKMGEHLRAKGLLPNLIVTSTAKRARSTAKLVAEAGGYRGEVRRDPALYLAPPDVYVRLASSTDDGIERLMLVGHNPGIEACVDILCGTEEVMPTAGLAVISAPIASWSELTLQVRCKLESFWRPKELQL